MKVISTDPDRWIGFTNDPAETDHWCAWIRIANRTLFVWFPAIFITKGRF